MRVAKAVVLTDEERVVLERRARGRSTPVRLVQRARIVLAAAQGKRNDEIAAELACTRRTVGVWRNRFLAKRLAGIEKDAPRPGRTPTITPQLAQAIIDKTTREKPAAATHWSTRTLARAMGINQTAVSRVWRTHQLKPHLTKTFKVSNDKRFVEKTIDIVGLYLNPPERAIVLSVDEKSQIQALDRTQPSLPMYPGRKGTLTHDYKRNGTTTLFAALDIESGVVISQCMARHRHQEWIKFLKHIDASTNPALDIHLICDNYATHKHAKVQSWLKRHPRFHVHFTPTSSSWLNLVERWFRELTDKRIRRGVFKSVRELIAAIDEYIEHHNDHTEHGYRWKAKAEDIIAKYHRAKAALDKVPSE
jgi:transposase